MDKLSDQSAFFQHPRKTVFCKTLRKGEFVNDEEHLPIHLGETKTVKVLHRKEQKFPPLNVQGSKHNSRPALLSLEAIGKKKLQRGKQRANKKANNQNYFLINPEQIMSNQNVDKIPNKTIKKFSIFPQILHNQLSSSNDPSTGSNRAENPSFSKTKRATKNTHCKILLARNSHFPFVGVNAHDHKVSGCKKAKEPSQDLMSPFRLNISRIFQKQEPVSPLFVSKESLNEIVIF